MALLGRKRRKRDPGVEKQIAVMDQDEKLQEEVSVLEETGQDRTLDSVQREVDSKVQEAARHSIQEVKMLEQGRCPDCGERLEQFLYTSICTSCGYSKRLAPETGKVVVHLTDGNVIECDKTFEVRTNVHLCVRNDVVVARISEEAVSYVEYLWTEEELKETRKRRQREIVRPCDWCGKSAPSDSNETQEIYIAIGMHRNKFFFCGEKCLNSFRKQYPARVHRDCYERDCSDCDECVKRYKPSGALW